MKTTHISAVPLIGMILILSMLTSRPAMADGTIYTGEPRLYFNPYGPHAQVTATTIAVDNFTVSVSYALHNNAERSYEAIGFLLDIPAFYDGGPAWEFPDRSFPELSMTLGATPIPYERKATAIFQGKDVTDIIAQYGLQPNDVADTNRWYDSMTDAVSESFAELKALGIMTENATPKWLAKNQFFARTQIPPRMPMRFAYSYKALPGLYYYQSEYPDQLKKSELQTFITRDILRDACGGEEALANYNILKMMQVPLWLYDNSSTVEKLDITIDMPPVSKRAPSVIILKLNGKIHSAKGSLHLSLTDFRQQENAWLLVVTPYSD